jgi:hypothetical protein
MKVLPLVAMASVAAASNVRIHSGSDCWENKGYQLTDFSFPGQGDYISGCKILSGNTAGGNIEWLNLPTPRKLCHVQAFSDTSCSDNKKVTWLDTRTSGQADCIKASPIWAIKVTCGKYSPND